jgi:putative exosortase-associated protein (TIGR04073 family)
MNARRAVLMALIAVGSLIATEAAGAEDTQPAATPIVCPICRQANNPQAPYAEKAGSTLVRGAINAAFGWTELLVQPTEEVNRHGNLAVGVGKGIGFAVKRTALGFGELLTFWTPKGKEGNFALAQDCPVCFSTTINRPPAKLEPAKKP